MKTTIMYMVRHGDSPKEGNDRTRGLTERGKQDARQITELLKGEGIEVFVSSPYSRAVQTIQELAHLYEKEILLYEELKERKFAGGDNRISDCDLYPLLEQSFSDYNHSLPDGESNMDCQMRAIRIVKELLREYQGKKIAIGTHGAVMTLIMGYFDSRYDLEFLLKLSKPDVYRLTFHGEELEEVNRLWGSLRNASEPETDFV